MPSDISHIVSALKSLAAQLAETSGVESGSNVVGIGEGRAPDKSLLKAALGIVESRKRRAKYHPNFFFGEPCWDMLLDLYIAREQRADLTVTQLCSATQIPHATALRYLGRLEALGDVTRQTDDRDHRRTYIRISDAAAHRMRASLADIAEYSSGSA